MEGAAVGDADVQRGVVSAKHLHHRLVCRCSRERVEGECRGASLVFHERCLAPPVREPMHGCCLDADRQRRCRRVERLQGSCRPRSRAADISLVANPSLRCVRATASEVMCPCTSVDSSSLQHSW